MNKGTETLTVIRPDEVGGLGEESKSDGPVSPQEPRIRPGRRKELPRTEPARTPTLPDHPWRSDPPLGPESVLTLVGGSASLGEESKSDGPVSPQEPRISPGRRRELPRTEPARTPTLPDHPWRSDPPLRPESALNSAAGLAPVIDLRPGIATIPQPGGLEGAKPAPRPAAPRGRRAA